MRISSKGQVTIPREIREKTGLLPLTEVELVVDGDEVRILKAHRLRRESGGAEAVRRLRNHAGQVTLSTDQIMALTRAGR